MNSRLRKDLNLQIHLYKAFFSVDRFLDSVHKSLLNQTTLDLGKEKWSDLNQDLPVLGFLNDKIMPIVKSKVSYLCHEIIGS